ncbi:MAG TPA: sugar phosphate nucleotidyltransferase, partial [Methanocorpusculum sp.]|nr:sugar phosphate nucleotidyltransferase [Methanocorpusculum sp.]
MTKSYAICARKFTHTFSDKKYNLKQKRDLLNQNNNNEVFLKCNITAIKMKKVGELVIPAAGWGTRFFPMTKSQPKEMIPVIDKPVIQHVVEDA